MSITDFRLAQIADLMEKIREKTTWLQEKQEELDAMQEIAASMDDATKQAVSQSASTSLITRGRGEATGIAEAAGRDRKILDDLEKAVKDAESDLAELQKEKAGLEEYVGRA